MVILKAKFSNYKYLSNFEVYTNFVYNLWKINHTCFRKPNISCNLDMLIILHPYGHSPMRTNTRKASSQLTGCCTLNYCYIYTMTLFREQFIKIISLGATAHWGTGPANWLLVSLSLVCRWRSKANPTSLWVACGQNVRFLVRNWLSRHGLPQQIGSYSNYSRSWICSDLIYTGRKVPPHLNWTSAASSSMSSNLTVLNLAAPIY